MELALPDGRAARRLRDGIRGRVGFGRRLVAFSPASPPIAFDPARSGLEITDRALMIGGDVASRHVSAILRALDEGKRQIELR